MTAFLQWLTAGLQFLSLLSGSVWLLSRPFVFTLYYSNPPQEARDAQAIVRWLNSQKPAKAINVPLRAGHLTDKETAHFGDVRRALQANQALFLACTTLLVGILAWKRFSPTLIRAAQPRCLVLCGTLSLFSLVLALWDWKVFFAWLHDPLFGPTSWRLPRNSYSLRLFPAPFWGAIGATVLLSPAVISALAALLLSRRGKKRMNETANS